MYLVPNDLSIDANYMIARFSADAYSMKDQSRLSHRHSTLSFMNNQTDSARLLEKIQQGETQAFCELVERYAAQYFRLAYRLTGHKEQAEDIIQDAFIKLWQAPYLWQAAKGASFETWFYKVITNLAIDCYRKNQRQNNIQATGPEQDAQNPEEAAQIALETHQRLQLAIKALPIRQRIALSLCVYEELSHQQAALVMGLKITALQSLLARAKRNLKLALRQEVEH